MTTNPKIRILNARAELDSARENCPHWDYDGDGDCKYECCCRLDDAIHEYYKWKRLLAKDS